MAISFSASMHCSASWSVDRRKFAPAGFARENADMSNPIQSIVSVMLRQTGRSWICAGAAGGSELPECAQAFRLGVAVPVALGRALGMEPSEAAQLGAMCQTHAEEFDGWLRWVRVVVDLPSGGMDALQIHSQEGQAAMARAFESAVGVPLFAEFEARSILGTKPKAPGGDWVSSSRDPSDLIALFAALEAKALEQIALKAKSKAGLGPSRI